MSSKEETATATATTPTAETKTDTKKIFFERLREEGQTYDFLRAITEEEILQALKTNQIMIPCSPRNPWPQYETTKSHIILHMSIFKTSHASKWFQCAIIATYKDYDPSIQYDSGDIAKMVWFRFCEARRYVKEETERRIRLERERKAAEYKEMRRIAALKRQEKENQQYLDLATKNPYKYSYEGSEKIYKKNGENIIEWGMRCFNLRMRVDQRIANAKEKTPSELSLTRFREWLSENPNYGDYGTDRAKQYSKFSLLGCSELTKYTQRYKVPKNNMLDVLKKLYNAGFKSNYNENNKGPNNLGVSIVVDYDRLNSQGFPNHSEIGYYTSNNSWSRLQGNTRTQTPITMNIGGLYANAEEHTIIITTKSNRVRQMLPKVYKDFEYMNKSKLFTLQECIKLPKEFRLIQIKVELRNVPNFPIIEFNESTKSTDEIQKWKEKVKYDQSYNFASYYYDENDPAKKSHREQLNNIDNDIARIREEKAARAKAAREAGLARKAAKKAAKGGETKQPANTRSKAENVIELGKLVEKGIITQERFNDLVLGM